MAGFSYKSGLRSSGHSTLQRPIIKNSTQLTVGDPVNTNTDGFADLATSSERFAGIVIGFENNDGTPITPASGRVSVLSHTATGSNQTVAKVRAVIDTDPLAVYSLEANATLGTTTGSNLYGVYFDITGSTGAVKAAESTVQGGGSAGGGSQLRSIGPDPENPTTHVLVSIRESELYA